MDFHKKNIDDIYQDKMQILADLQVRNEIMELLNKSAAQIWIEMTFRVSY